MSTKYTLVNEETGEIIEAAEAIRRCKEMPTVTKAMVDNMLYNAKKIDDVDLDMLYGYIKKSGGFNRFNQVRLLGRWYSDGALRLSYVDVLMAGYLNRVLSMMHDFTNIILQENRRTAISTWTELFDIIGLTNKGTRTKFKKFCEDNDIIRIDKTLKTKSSTRFVTRLVVNPFIIRRAEHVGQVAIGRFSDWAKEGVNIDTYAYRYLQCQGILGNELLMEQVV